MDRIDAVEIKISVADDQVASAESFFTLAAHEEKRRTIYFCEDLEATHAPATLALLSQGVIIRLRKNKGGADDVTVKLRPCHRWQLTPQWLKAHEGNSWQFRVEEDWAGEKHVLAASQQTDAPGGAIQAMVERGRGVDLSPRQQDFLEDCAVQPVDLDRLAILGPITARKWSVPYEHGHDIAVELWRVADAMRFLEFSIRVAPDEAAAAQKRLVEQFGTAGLPTDSVQETKTKLVLDYFAEHAGT